MCGVIDFSKNMIMSYRDSHVISSFGVDKQMRNAYDVWRRHFYESDIESTPSYDVVGLLAALCLHHRRSPHTYFDIGPLGSNKNDEQEGADVYKLKSSYRSKDKPCLSWETLIPPRYN